MLYVWHLPYCVCKSVACVLLHNFSKEPEILVMFTSSVRNCYCVTVDSYCVTVDRSVSQCGGLHMKVEYWDEASMWERGLHL